MNLSGDFLLLFARAAARDALSLLPTARGMAAHPAADHLREAAAWLARAHDATPDDGVSYGYSVKGGWRPSYIETSGYILETFFDLAAIPGAPGDADDWRARATRIAHWLRRVQNADGSFCNPLFNHGDGIVFDTGQDLHGLVRAWEETGDRDFLAAAERAGAWLVTVADERGCWTRNTHNGIPHVYNTRVAWALLRLHAHAARPDFPRVARANLNFALAQQRPGGLFDQCAFETGVAPFTHTIAYAIRGLLESSRLTEDDGYGAAARRAAEAVGRLLLADGHLPGQITPHGAPAASYNCLTGACQMAIIWSRLAGPEALTPWKTWAIAALRHVMALQDLQTSDANVRGAIKGSHPIWGRYAPMSYPNWATKFYLEALMACRAWL